MTRASQRHLGSYPAVTGHAARVQSDAVTCTHAWPGAASCGQVLHPRVRRCPDARIAVEAPPAVPVIGAGCPESRCRRLLRTALWAPQRSPGLGCSGRGRAGWRGPGQRIEAAVDGGPGDIGEPQVVVAGVGLWVPKTYATRRYS